MKDLNELRDKAYQCAVVHGWHEEDLSNEHFLCLVISELMETGKRTHLGLGIRLDGRQPRTILPRLRGMG